MGFSEKTFSCFTLEDTASIKSLLTRETLPNYRLPIWNRDEICEVGSDFVSKIYLLAQQPQRLRPPVLNDQSLPEMAQVLRPPGT